MFGFFSNFAPLRIHCRRQTTFLELLSAVGKKIAAVYSASDIPFDELIAELLKAGIAAPEVAMMFQKTGESRDFNIGSLTVRTVRWVRPNFMPWRLSVAFAEGDEGYFSVGFNGELYDPVGVRKFTDDLCRFFEVVSRRPDQTIETLVAAAGITPQR